MVKYPNAASGIKKVFLAKIIGVIGVPLAFIPGIGASFDDLYRSRNYFQRMGNT
mgnify:CR=1 FL=1